MTTCSAILSDVPGERPPAAHGRLGRLAPVAGGALSDEDRLILEAATGARRLSAPDLRRVLQHVQHVAQAGFPPEPNVRATDLAGVMLGGRVLRGSDRITAAERHYLEYVVKTQEWPAGTTLQEYVDSVR